MKDLIREALVVGIELRQKYVGLLDDDLLRAADVMVKSLKNGGKILVCGNGGSASDAQHFVAELNGTTPYSTVNRKIAG